MLKSTNLKALFAKYMKVEDEKTAHAVLSASGSERWLGCPASISLSKGKPQVVHDSAQVGTNAHTLLQFILENANWSGLLMSKEGQSFKEYIGYCPAQLKSVMVAVKFVHAERRKMYRVSSSWPQMYVEQKLKLDGVGFGTTDVMLYQPFGLLHIIDYKNGVYPVSPNDNTQGLYYGVAAADMVGWDFNKVKITIIQPNVPRGETIKTWTTTPKRLEQAKLMFERGALLTRKKNPAIVPNHKYCWFCSARPTCPAHVKVREQKIMSRFERTAK
jgi:uncharacterized protein DUF2800